MFGKRQVATWVAELLGTGFLTLLILSVQRSTIGVPFFVALAAGMSLALVTFVLGSRGTGYFNPAVTLGLWTARRLETLHAAVLIVMQFVGAWAAYMLYTYYVNTTLQPVGGKFVDNTLVAEAVGAGILALAVAAVAYRAYTAAASAAFVGLAYTVGIIAASPAAIGLLNPAVALGTRAWVLGTYVLGPVLGALVAVNLYAYLFVEKDDVVAVAAATAPAVAAKPVVTKRATTAKKAPAKKKPAAKKRTTTTRRK